MRVHRILSLTLAAGLLALAPGVVAAQSYYEEEGFFLFLDTVFATPRDTDQVIAVTEDVAGTVQQVRRVQTEWGSSPAGRIEFGYRWPSGNEVSASFWQFDDDERTVGDGPAGGFTNFALGPFIYYSGYGYFGVFGQPGHWDVVSSIEARSVQVNWSHDEDLSEYLGLEWSLGLRFAQFEETLSGFYDYYESGNAFFGYYTYAVQKTQEASMAGLGAGVRARYAFSDAFSVESGLQFSFLEGDVESRARMTPVGSVVAGVLPAAAFEQTDSDRSGTILDFDVRAVWHLAEDRYRVYFGYEHSRWRGLPTDLTRNITGTFVPLTRREQVSFSGFKVGVGFRF